MPNLSVKDVPEQWAEALRQRAARNHRSLQGELMAIIETAVVTAVPVGAELSASGKQGAVLSVRRGWKTVEQVAAELKAKYPNGPVLGQPLGVDIIREDRDSR